MAGLLRGVRFVCGCTAGFGEVGGSAEVVSLYHGIPLCRGSTEPNPRYALLEASICGQFMAKSAVLVMHESHSQLGVTVCLVAPVVYLLLLNDGS